MSCVRPHLSASLFSVSYHCHAGNQLRRVQQLRLFYLPKDALNPRTAPRLAVLMSVSRRAALISTASFFNN